MTLAQYLWRYVTEAEGADEWRVFTDFVERTLRVKDDGRQTQETLDSLRMAKIIAAALIEALRNEELKGHEPPFMIPVLTGILGYMTFNVAISRLRDEAPHAELIRLLTETFRTGAKEASDVLRRSNSESN